MALTLARWRPLAEMEDMRRRMERMLEEVGNGEGARRWNLSIDLIERDDKYVLRADVPGLKAEEVKIEVADDVLTISARTRRARRRRRTTSSAASVATARSRGRSACPRA